jgi:hypothetical protein
MRRHHPETKLSDAQLAAARDYGFTSWPALVDYFRMLARHEQSGKPPAWYPREYFEKSAERMVSGHSRTDGLTASRLATFVPRFYGRSMADVLNAQVTLDDARLVIARENRYPNWEAFVEYLQTSAEGRDSWQRALSPGVEASKAVRKMDLVSLEQLLDAHPQLLTPPKPREIGAGPDLMHSAILNEWNSGDPSARQVTDFLIARGADLQAALNRAMLYLTFGYDRGTREGPGTISDRLDFLISRGADPEWIPPNGLTLLEHALLRPQNGPDIVNALARHCTPRKAFWIAAALGDTDGLRRYFGKSGELTPAARKNRPDFTAAGPFSLPLVPNASDTHIMWEAFYIAVQNGRYESMDVLLDHGLPIDYALWGRTIMWHATNSRDVTLVEYLLKRGAIFDIQDVTAAQLDQWLYEGPPTDANARKIYELCGGKDADAVLRRYESTPPAPPTMVPFLVKALELAAEEAARLGQAEVEPENLFFALFRDERYAPLAWLQAAGADLAAFRRAIQHRLVPTSAAASDVPLGALANEMLERLKISAVQTRRTHITPLHLLSELVRDDASTAASILARVGTDLAALRKTLAHD